MKSSLGSDASFEDWRGPKSSSSSGCWVVGLDVGGRESSKEEVKDWAKVIAEVGAVVVKEVEEEGLG